MEVFAQTDNSLDLLNTEKGFRTTLFGFARDEVLAFIDQMMSNNAVRNKQLNNTISDMEAKLTELQDENEALLDKTRLLVDQLEEKRGDHIQNSREIDQLQMDLAEQTRLVEEFKAKLFSREQEHNLSLSEIATLKKQITTLENRLSDAKESSKCADDIIVTAQRAASKIMTEAVKQSPKPEPTLNMPELSSIKDTIVSLEKQLKSVTETVEFALNAGSRPDETAQSSGYYSNTNNAPVQQDYQTNGGWISAQIPQPTVDQNPTYWQPMERPTTPVGWQQPQSASYISDVNGGVTLSVDMDDQHMHIQGSESNSVYHHRRADAVPQYSSPKVVRPTPVNYSKIRRQKGTKYIVTPHKRHY